MSSRIRKRSSTIGAALATAVLAFTQGARAGDFDASGRFAFDPDAVDAEDFAEPETAIPSDFDPECAGQVHYVVQPTDDALSGGDVIVLEGARECPEHFALEVPAEAASYSARIWVRHGVLNARVRVEYPLEAERVPVSVRFAPTGRATSDGWVELATNAFSVEGDRGASVHVRLTDGSDIGTMEVDALELLRDGDLTPERACEGAADPVCGSEALCIYGRCREGRYGVPPLPEGELQDAMVDSIRARLETFFGGRKTRLEDLPAALDELEGMRDAETAWQFWNGFGTAIRRLHDWHTSAGSSVLEVAPRGRLNACFIEGDADLSHDVFPRDETYADLLVSHVGPDAAGLKPGDRLVAVDGQHPIAWARELIEIDWGYHVATDAASFADFAEALGGPYWIGNALILKYARTITVVRCPEGVCGLAETLDVEDLVVVEGGGSDVVCDNRPFYHLEEGGPDPTNHYVFDAMFRGRIAGTTEEEAIFGMVWDTLYGGGDPNGPVNGVIRDAVAEWKASARGVILDHRAGNGGTIDAPQYLTELVRPERELAVLPNIIASAGYSGPANPEEGLALFDAYPSAALYVVGSAGYDPELPVALVLHRDGSASDYLPEGMKGSEKVRLFGPHPTAGAFSTYIQFSYWGGVSFQIASGDTITDEGDALIGKGVVPDEIVEQRQSDLVQGRDSIHEAALAWVRANLKPEGARR